MRAGSQSPALMRARHRWRCLAAVVASRAYQRERWVSAWLRDQAYRRDRGVAGADQLARLVSEMEQAGFGPEEQDAALLELTAGLRRDVQLARTQPDRPAA